MAESGGRRSAKPRGDRAPAAAALILAPAVLMLSACARQEPAPRAPESATLRIVPGAPAPQATSPGGVQPLTATDIATRIRPTLVSVKTPVGQGTGFFVGPGLVVTNLHVVAGQSQIQVTTHDGRSHAVASIAALDTAFDLAALRVGPRAVPVVELGDSDAARQGDSVLAFGNPLGLEATLSTGIISARREFAGGYALQTSAAISPGSSGGPLLNARGEVIGVTSLLAANGQNLSFAVPSIYVKRLIEFARGRGYTMQQFAARTQAANASPSPPQGTPAAGAPRISQATFPTSVAGFRFGMSYEQLVQACPDVSGDRQLAKCPYPLVALPFAAGPVALWFTRGVVTSIGIAPIDRLHAAKALTDKYGEPESAAWRAESWQPAASWPQGKAGAYQWRSNAGDLVRLGSTDGRKLFLIFVHGEEYAQQLENY